MIRGNIGWNVAKLMLRLCPSKTRLTVEKMSKVSNDPSPVCGVFLAVLYANCLTVLAGEVEDSKTTEWEGRQGI